MRNTDINYVATTVEHVRHLTDNMREKDIEECHNSAKGELFDIVSDSVGHSKYCVTLFINGELACILGLTEYSPDVGVPWMLATDVMAANKRVLIHESKRVLNDMLSIYSKLFNYVQADNKKAVQALRHCGFKMEEPAPMFHNGVNFIRFSYEVINNV